MNSEYSKRLQSEYVRDPWAKLAVCLYGLTAMKGGSLQYILMPLLSLLLPFYISLLPKSPGLSDMVALVIEEISYNTRSALSAILADVVDKFDLLPGFADPRPANVRHRHAYASASSCQCQ
ncbi:MAG: hypothetical protein SV775_12100 [Thermodesulfobacteriota bacterium]|nr:hypothetical protein [Thermodesulfobacteriota bacterium]